MVLRHPLIGVLRKLLLLLESPCPKLSLKFRRLNPDLPDTLRPHNNHNNHNHRPPRGMLRALPNQLTPLTTRKRLIREGIPKHLPPDPTDIGDLPLVPDIMRGLLLVLDIMSDPPPALDITSDLLLVRHNTKGHIVQLLRLLSLQRRAKRRLLLLRLDRILSPILRLLLRLFPNEPNLRRLDRRLHAQQNARRRRT